ncbi:MAG: hypothetical protein IJX51_00620 [Clostridia bacterium]|nr:hypothetical protein [Clostridia bacterium]
MFEIADIHCHMLGGVDDGAKNTDEMKTMLDIAYNDGIRHICFTPHFKIYHFKDSDSIKAYNKLADDQFEVAKEYVSEKYPDLHLYIGNEIMYHAGVIDSSDTNLCRRINNGSYLLVEFQPEITIFEMRNAVSKILRKGFIPVIAHVERYTELVKKPNFAWELKEYGALLQVNASTVTKAKFGKTKAFLNFLFKKSYVDVIASDAHSSDVYKPIISKAAEKILKKYGEATARRVCYTNPIAIINNVKLF